MAAFFLTGQTRSDPAWPFFFAGRRRNDRPDRVRPGLAIQKNAAHVVHLTAGVNNYKLSLEEDVVGMTQPVNTSDVMYDDEDVTSVSRTGRCQHVTWSYNVTVDERAQPGVNTVHRQLTVSVARHMGIATGSLGVHVHPARAEKKIWDVIYRGKL